MKLSGWGRFPVIEARVLAPRSLQALRHLVQSEQSLIARGNGRAYGDSAISRSATVHMRHFNRMLDFDPATGQLVAESGVLIGDIIAAFLPRGWFPMITPGTKFVSLGGAIAADVHGKNHHKDGSFRRCVDWIEVMEANGDVRRCSPVENGALFDQTLGGMGLTGITLRAAVRLRPVETAWIRQNTIAAPDLASVMDAFETARDATYSVAWIDCLGSGPSLGRSLVMLGEHATLADLPDGKVENPLQAPPKRRLSVPFDVPAIALNRLSVRVFNALHYRVGAQKHGAQLVDWDSYFYPLDAILGWNRIYGRKGFMQFQCVLPLERSREGLTALLDAISQAGSGSFLAVLKRFGPQDGLFSFPMEGYTLALDFPVNAKTIALLQHLDRIALNFGGRFYLAKDSRMTPETLRASDPRRAEFCALRESLGQARRFHSVQSERLVL